MRHNWLSCIISLLSIMTHASHINDIQSRGWLICGVEINKELEGNHLNQHNEVEGFQANNCRALAVALLNDIHAVQYVDVSKNDGIALLKNEIIDVLYPSSPQDQSRVYVNKLIKATNNQYIMHNMPDHDPIPRSVGPLTHSNDLELNRVIQSIIYAQLHADDLNINSQNVADVFSPLDDDHVFHQIVQNAQHESFNIECIKHVIESVGNYSEMYTKHIDRAQTKAHQAPYNNVSKHGGKIHLPTFN